MKGKFSFHRLPQIPNQVKTIGNLDGVGTSSGPTFNMRRASSQRTLNAAASRARQGRE
jgi:hypothetical protein